MKKFIVLTLALALVCGVSVVGFAEKSSGNIDDNGLEHGINVGINVEQYATIDVGEVDTRFTDTNSDGTTVNLSEPGNPNKNAIGFPITVKSNADFTLTAEETVSRSLAAKIGEGLIWAFDGSGENYIVAPNVEFFAPDWSSNQEGNAGFNQTEVTGKDGIKRKLTFAEGTRKFDGLVQFNAQYLENSINGENDFTQLESAEYEGQVILTVAGAPTEE